jgi:TupA-like ATPgrasp
MDNPGGPAPVTAADQRPLTGRVRRVAYSLPLPLRRRLMYLRRMRRVGRFSHPQTFTEKINWRILHDRRELLSWTCDKMRMKEYATRTVGSTVRVPRTLWSGRDVAELAALDLPGHWVLKPNHLSGPVVFGAGPVTDVEDLRRRTTGWLAGEHYDTLGEWAYGAAEQTLLAEERIGDPATSPDDYKLFTFGGRTAIIQVDTGRFSDHRRRYYDVDWRPLELTAYYPTGPLHPRPAGLERMLAAAEELGRPFDMMRVDLYDVAGEVWFGELTPYPGGGLEGFTPTHWDADLGRMWQLPPT